MTDFKPIYTQEEFDERVRQRIRRERMRTVRALIAKLEEYAESLRKDPPSKGNGSIRRHD